MKKFFKCPVCNEKKEFTFVMDVENKNWRKIKTKKFSYYLCSDCSFWVLFPQLTIPEKRIIYKGNYYTNLSTPIENLFVKQFFKLKLFLSYRDFVLENTNKKNILDVGCGAGDFIYEMKQNGYEVAGIDPYDDAVALSQKKVGKKNVIKGSISSLKKTRKVFDNITMWHVLEHTNKPFDDIRILLTKLKKGGFFFIEVPNSDSFNMHIFKNYYAWHMIPEHHYYFNIKSITKLLEDAGFRIKNIHTPPRALLNFSYSVDNAFANNYQFRKFLFVVSIPVSIFLTCIFSVFQKGEVIRVIAVKK